MSTAPEGRKLLRVEARNAEVPIEKKPHWIKTKAIVGPEYNEMRELARGQGLHTVPESSPDRCTDTTCVKPRDAKSSYTSANTPGEGPEVLTV